MAAKDILSILLGGSVTQVAEQQALLAGQESTAQMYEAFGPFALGTKETKENKKRHRKDIMTKWELMAKFAPIAEALGIHIAAALGGDEHTSQQVFIVPSERLRSDSSKANAAQLKQLESRIKTMERLINKNIVKICRDAIAFGDGYTRIYGKKNKGLIDLVCNEYTYPPAIQAYEQGSRTVAFHALEPRNWIKKISKLSPQQLVRMKMPRVTHIPQYEMVEGVVVAQMLETDDIDQLPILPAHVGGSFLYEIEEFFDNVVLALAGMNSQQVADAVNQMFLTLNMSGMPPYQREAYKRGLEGMLNSHEEFVRNALSGGEAIWGTKYHILPTWDDKQILNPVGDIKGQRTSPINIETFMTNVKLMMGGLGMDLSMVGFAELLTGGIGEGASFQTSAQIMRRSMLIRQAAADVGNSLMKLDWGFAFNQSFTDDDDLPWRIEFYSDQSAAATAAINNKQQRMNTLMLKAQAIGAIKEIGISEKNAALLLEKDGGMDYDEAQSIAADIVKAQEQELAVQDPLNNPTLDEETPTDDNNDDEEI